MATLSEMQKKIESININTILTRVLKVLEPEMIDMNMEDQLWAQGIYASGSPLPGPYAPSTIRDKKGKGQRTDHITLRDTKGFNKGGYIKFMPQSIQLWSSDGKTDMLVWEWGKEIFGLTDKNLNEITWDQIYPRIMDELHKVLS